jgi:isocitrate lyase
MSHIAMEAGRLVEDWQGNPRWQGVTRDYGAEDVVRLP